MDGLGRPPFTTTVLLHTEIDTQLPTCHGRVVAMTQSSPNGTATMGRPWANHGLGERPRQASMKRAAEQVFTESGRRDSNPRPSPWQRYGTRPPGPSQSPDVVSCPPIRPPSPSSPPIPYTGLPSPPPTKPAARHRAHRRRPGSASWLDGLIPNLDFEGAQPVHELRAGPAIVFGVRHLRAIP